MSIYEISLEGTSFNLEQYRQIPLVIVNIADTCGFSSQLQSLSQLNQDKEIPCQVLAFPSNSFKQQLRNTEDMLSWCDASQRINFPVYEVIEVNGNNTHQLFKYLKYHARGMFGQQKIMWNYTKFVILPNESKIMRFSPATSIKRIQKRLKYELISL